MDKVEIVDKRVEMNFIISTGLYYLTRILMLTKISLSRGRQPTPMTEDGQKTMNKLLKQGGTSGTSTDSN